MSKLDNENYTDPIENILNAIKLEGLIYLARNCAISTKGKKKDIINRFLTSLIPLREILETLRIKELTLIHKHLGLSPLPRNRKILIDEIYNNISKQFAQGDLFECIRDKYKLIRTIGEGGQGTVFLAREYLTGRVVAIKHARLPEEVTAIHRELRVLASIDHPSTERLYTYEISRECPSMLFLVVEYCSNLSLQKAIFEDKLSFSFEEMATIIEQALSGLVYYHSHNIVHGDISISNIVLLSPNKSKKSWGLKFIDFGASRVGFEPIITPIQNKRYTAPEISLGSPARMCSDVFSLSAVIAEFISGKLFFTYSEQKSDPYFIKNWINTYIQYPDLIRHVLIAGLNPNPTKRIQNGIEMRKRWLYVLGKLREIP